MDALMVNEIDVWDPADEVISQVDSMCSNITRVLNPKGLFIQISFAQPHFRTKYLMAKLIQPKEEIDPYSSYQGICKKYSWNLTFSPMDLEKGCLVYYIFYMTKY